MSVSKRGLGKGLEALLPDTEERTEVGVQDIHARADQPRRSFDEGELQGLARSISQHGLLQPLVVAPDDSGYTLIAGERRLRAAKLAGLTHVPVFVRTADEQSLFELALVENVQRADLNPVEEARAYQRLLTETGLTHAELAERVGKSRSRVSNYLRLLDLPDTVLRALERREVSPGHANALLAVPVEKRGQLFAAITRDNLSVRQAERWRTGGKTGVPHVAAPGWLRDLESLLGTKIERTGTDQRGKLVIHYHSAEELETLRQRLSD